MELTKRQSIELSIELWKWMEETGTEYKRRWPGWEKYGHTSQHCFLCEYEISQEDDSESGLSCPACPYYAKFGDCINRGTPYHKWCNAKSVSTRKEYAGQFIEQLKTLLKEI